MTINYFPVGRPATEGTGPERYTIRFVLWIPENVMLDDLRDIEENSSTDIPISGKAAKFEKRHNFWILRIEELDTLAAAEALANQVATGLIRLTARTGAAVAFSFPPSAIIREPSNGFDRDNLDPINYPNHWRPRQDGTRTDGGIFAHQTCILPEHERIWEYPTLFGKPHRLLRKNDISIAIQNSTEFMRFTPDNEFICGINALWAGCAQNDRRLTFILLVTALDVLAENEDVANWTDALKEVIAEMKDAITLHSEGDQRTLLDKLSRKIDEIGKPGRADLIRKLVLRAFGLEPGSPKGNEIIKEVSKIYGKRGSIAHGGNFLSPPSADENERLREIVAAAIDLKIRDLGRIGQESSPPASAH
jgi:hypothetical protein